MDNRLYSNHITLSSYNKQIKEIENCLRKRLRKNCDIQRLLWIPAIGLDTAFSIYLEIIGMGRFETVKKFLSYCRLAPGTKNSNKSIRHKSGSNEGNKYLKIAFSDSAVHEIRHYPEIRTHYQKMLRRTNQAIARAIVAKRNSKNRIFHIKK